MAQKTGDYYSELDLRNRKYLAKLRGSSLALDKFARAGKIGFAGVAVAVTAATTAVTLLSKKSITLAVNFDESMRKVNTLAQLGQAGFEGMKDRILDLSQTLGKNAKEMGDALYQVISATFEGTEAMEVLKTGVKMATAGMAGQLETVDALTTVLNAWGLEAKDAQKVADTFFLTIKYGKTTMAELAPSVGLVATMAANAGVSFEEVGAALSALTIVGVNTNRAVTGLSAIFTALTKPTDEAKIAAEEMGIDFSIAGLKAEGLDGWLRKLKDATQGESEALAKFFPNVRAVRAILPLATNAAASFNSTLAKMRSETGAMDDAFVEMNQAYSRQIKFFKTKWTKALIDFGETIWPMVGKWMDELSSPEMLQRAQFALIDLAEVVTTALANIPLLISNIALNFESLHHMLLRAQKGHAIFMRVVSGWNTEIGVLWREVIEEINEDLGESEGKIDRTAEGFAKWHLTFQELIPDFDKLREGITKTATAGEELADDFIFSTVALGPYIEEIDKFVFSTKQLGPYMYEMMDGMDGMGKSMSKMSYFAEQAAEAIGTMLGTLITKGADAGAIIRRLVVQLMQMAVTQFLPGPLGALFGGVIQGVGFQKGGYLASGNFPMGLVKQPMVTTIVEGGRPELVLPPEELGKFIQVHVHEPSPNTYVKVLLDIPDEQFDRIHRDKIKPAQQRDNYR